MWTCSNNTINCSFPNCFWKMCFFFKIIIIWPAIRLKTNLYKKWCLFHKIISTNENHSYLEKNLRISTSWLAINNNNFLLFDAFATEFLEFDSFILRFIWIFQILFAEYCAVCIFSGNQLLMLPWYAIWPHCKMAIVLPKLTQQGRSEYKEF